MYKQRKSHPHGHHTHWRKSLPFKFSVIQLVIASILICSTLWLTLSVQREQLLTQQQEVNQSYGQLIVSHLHEVTTQIEGLVMSIASMGRVYRYDSEHLTKTIPSILDAENQRNVIISGGIWPEPGAFDANKTQNSYFWVRNTLGEFVKNDDYNTTTALSYHGEDWYRPMRFFPSGKTFWSKSYIDPYTHEAMVTASVPMWMDHEFIGVATVDMSLQGIGQRLHAEIQNLNGYVITLDNHNRIISFPNQDSGIDHGVSSQFSLMDFSQLSQHFPQYQTLETAINTADLAFIEHAKANRLYTSDQINTLLHQASGDEKALMGALINNTANNWPLVPKLLSQFEQAEDPWLHEPVLVSVFLMPSTYWKIVTITPLSSLKDEAKQLTGKVGLYLILMQLLALIVLFLLQYRLFVTPLSRIVNALSSDNPAKLELDASNRNDEVGLLAKAFISRTHQLEIALASLDAGNIALEQQLQIQQRAQQELKQYKDQLNALLKSSNSLIYIKDLDGRYILVNDKFCEMLGIEKRHVLSATDGELFPTTLAKIYHDNDKRVLQSQHTMSFEEPIPTLQGDAPFLVTKFAIFDDDEQVVAIGAIAFDISAKKQIEQQYSQLENLYLHEKTQHEQRLADTRDQIAELKLSLQQQSSDIARHTQLSADNLQQEKLMQTLMSGVVQQLMTEHDRLVANLCAQSDSLTSTLFDEYLADMTQQADKLRHLHLLLSHTQQEDKPINIKHFIERILVLVTPQLSAQQVKVTLNCDDHIIVDTDPWDYLLLLYRLLTNTISHAFKVHHESRCVTIVIEKLDGFIDITVQDNGAGLTSSQLAQLQQHIEHDVCSGTLSCLSLWVALKMQGHLNVESEQGIGTKIHCSIPANKEAQRLLAQKK